MNLARVDAERYEDMCAVMAEAVKNKKLKLTDNERNMLGPDLGDDYIELSSSWSVYVDANETDSLLDQEYSLSYVGTFQSSTAFWRFWKAFGMDQGALRTDNLPSTCNIRMVRSGINIFEP